MLTYITLIRFSDEGAKTIKESPARLDRARVAVEAAGGKIKAFYLTLGQYDAVAINEAPSEEAYAATLLAIASAGAIRTETLRAFTEEEYRKIIAAVP